MEAKKGNVLKLLPETFVVVKLPPEASPPNIPSDAAKKCSFITVSITPEECSLITPENTLPEMFTTNQLESLVDMDKDWRCFKVEGPLDFGIVGILHRILDPLKSANISVLAVGTFNTDYFMVKREKLDGARVALIEAGFTIND